MSQGGAKRIGPSNGARGVQVIMCPWHRFNLPHPEGAVYCQPTEDLQLGWAIPLADLITWMAIQVGYTIPLLKAFHESFGIDPGLVESLEVAAAEVAAAEVESAEGEPT